MLNSARRHRLALGVAAAGSALVLAACGADETDEVAETGVEEAEEVEEEDEEQDSAADGEWVNGPIPDESPRLDESELPTDQEPDSDAPLGERLAWEAFTNVAEMAVMVDPDSTWECPDIEGEDGETATCSVTFLEEDYEYEITVTDGGGFLISYEAELVDGPLVRETAEDAVRYSADTEDVRCDMEDVVRTPLNTEDAVECQALLEDDEVRDYTVEVTVYGTLSPSAVY